jgi:hypothetical protein
MTDSYILCFLHRSWIWYTLCAQVASSAVLPWPRRGFKLQADTEVAYLDTCEVTNVLNTTIANSEQWLGLLIAVFGAQSDALPD